MPTFAELKTRLKDSRGHDLTLQQYQLLAGLQTPFAEKKGRAMDANEGFALVRKLTQFLNTIYMVKPTPSLKFTEVLPYNPAQFDKGARHINWGVQEDMGKLDFLSNGATDLPTLGANLDEKTVNVKIAGARIAWTWEDIEAAIYAGVALPTTMAQTARRLTDKFHDDVTAFGSSKHNVKGLLSDFADMTKYNNHTSVNWSGLTVTERVSFVKALARKVSDVTSNTENAGVVILPPAYMNALEDDDYGSDNTQSAADAIRRAFRTRGIRLVDWYQFQGVTVSETGTTITNKDMAMALPFSPEAGENMIVDPFFMKPPKEDANYNITSGVFTKTAGVVKRLPKTFVSAILN